MKVSPNEFKLDAHHWLDPHGRYVSTRPQPHCNQCIVPDLCDEFRRCAVSNRKTPMAVFSQDRMALRQQYLCLEKMQSGQIMGAFGTNDCGRMFCSTEYHRYSPPRFNQAGVFVETGQTNPMHGALHTRCIEQLSRIARQRIVDAHQKLSG